MVFHYWLYSFLWNTQEVWPSTTLQCLNIDIYCNLITSLIYREWVRNYSNSWSLNIHLRHFNKLLLLWYVKAADNYYIDLV